MQSVKCNKCEKPINVDDNFCQYCGSPVKKEKATSAKTKPTPKTKTTKNTAKKKPAVKQLQKVSASAVLKWISIALITGLTIGLVRYWIGYYVLIQGVIVGLLIPYMIKKTAITQMEALANIRFKMAIVLFFSFMIAQAFGFGLAQPVFDPFNWVARVWNGDTTESVFAIFSTAGVVHGTFSEGLSGGFWALLSFIDLFFMFFFILISMPLTTNKTKS